MSETTPKQQRGPTNLRIKFRSASLDQFIERYAVDVSRGGIFIRTREPLAVGTQLRLELQLQDAAPLLSGEGTVIWIRESDPSRPSVPPGMAVRFDKVSPETQPTLDRILAEKTRMEEAGQLRTQEAGGMAVRRPSSVLPTLDNSGRVGTAASNAPTAPVPAPAAAPATKTSFLGSKATPSTGSPPAAGPFTRARQTSTRPVPVPSALFEPPSPADIDKALSVLEEAPGPAPMPPMPSVPRFVPEDVSNEPTRVGDMSAHAAATADAIEELPADAIESETSAPQAAEPSLPPAAGVVTAPPAAAAAGTTERSVVNAPSPAAPEVSRRFRAASRPYPTLNKRRGTGAVIALILLVGAAAAAVWKLRPGSTVPLTPTTAPAASIAPAPAPAAPTAAAPGAPAPAAPAAPPEAAPPAPKPEIKAAETKPAETKPVAEKEKSSSEEHSSSRRGSHRKGREEGSKTAREAAAAKPADAKPAETPPPADQPAAEKPAAPEKEAAAPAAEKPAEAKPAGGLLKITSSPAGADVTIDGSNVGTTPFSTKDIDPGSPHVIRLVKDGFEAHERMIGTSDWSRPKGSSPSALKVNVKLRRIGPPPGSETPKEGGAPTEDTGGPYIKEVSPTP